MIGNIEGVDGVIDNKSFRIFSEPVPEMRVEIEEMLEGFMAVRLTEIQDNLLGLFTQAQSCICLI